MSASSRATVSAGALPMSSSQRGSVGTSRSRPRREPRGKLDPRKSNGGVLLGLRDVVVKSHGGTDAEGFAYAVDVGYEMVRYDLLTKINQMLNRDDDGASRSAPTAQEAVS